MTHDYLPFDKVNFRATLLEALSFCSSFSAFGNVLTEDLGLQLLTHLLEMLVTGFNDMRSYKRMAQCLLEINRYGHTGIVVKQALKILGNLHMYIWPMIRIELTVQLTFKDCRSSLASNESGEAWVADTLFKLIVQDPSKNRFARTHTRIVLISQVICAVRSL